MTKSKVQKDKEDKAAAWLYDAYGQPDEDEDDFRPEATDFIRFMKANGWEFRPTVMILPAERAPF